MNEQTGVWSYVPTCADVPSFVVEVAAWEWRYCSQSSCLPGIRFTVNIAPPPLELAPGGGVAVFCGQLVEYDVGFVCGYPPYSYQVVAGPGTVDPTGKWTYLTDCPPTGNSPVAVEVTDAAAQTDTCTFIISVGSAPCFCPFQGDPKVDGVINVLDVMAAINRVFKGAARAQDPTCSRERADFNADGKANVLDVVAEINRVFKGGPLPVDPCL